MILNIFSRIFLAHFLADFPFQFDFIFKWKQKGFLGIIPHSFIHIFFIYLFLPSLHIYRMFYVYLALVLFLHTLQDNTKFLIWSKRKTDNIWLFLLDQFVHILVMFVIFLFPFVKYFNPSEPLLLSSSRLNLFFSFLIFISFGGTIVMYYIDKTFYSTSAVISKFERGFGVIERILLFAFVSKSLYFLLLTPLFYLIRRKFTDNNSTVERGLYSIVFSSIFGIIFHFF